MAWLLSIMKNAAQAAEMLAAAPDVQRALLGLLADSNEVTQELASKGLSTLYDACDDEMQEKITSELVKGLQAGRATSRPFCRPPLRLLPLRLPTFRIPTFPALGGSSCS